MERIEITVGAAEAETRLDSLVSTVCGISRTMAQQLIAEGQVLVGDSPAAKGRRLAEGEVLAVTVPQPKEVELVAQDIPLDILHEDADLLVVNKPKGMVVHPAAGNPDGTLVNALMFHCAGSLSGIGGELRPGIVHRIDKDTSGLLVVAKNDAAHQDLARQFAEHSTRRVYDAVVYGHFKESTGRVDAPIGRDPKNRKRMAVVHTHSKQAATSYELVGEYPGFSHLKLRLETGRTHQIRVHMAQIGHPLAGDAVYGPKKVIKKLNGQCLHAGTLGFTHPKTGEDMLFSVPLPGYFIGFLNSLGANIPLED